MTKTRTHTFTAKVSAATHDNLNFFLEQLRQLWNICLAERRDLYAECGTSRSFYDQCKFLTALRRHHPSFSQFCVEAERTILNRLDKAFKAFFRRVKAGEKPEYPRFKGIGRVRSFEMSCPRIHTTEKGWHSIVVKGIGRFRFKGNLPEGKIKMLRIVKTPKRIQVMLVVESEVVPVAADDRAPLGLDVGVKARVTLSNGFQAEGNIIDRRENRRRHRAISRSQKGSNSRGKKVATLQRECQATSERELGKLYELAAWLIKHHGNKFYVEDIKPGNLTRRGRGKRGLNRAILEQQWGKFLDILTYKAEEAGGWVIRVNPYNTSQWCSACGTLPEKKIGLEVRDYRCETCGHEMDRDENAANNILRVGQQDHPPGGKIPGVREGSSKPTGMGSGPHGTV